MFGYTLAGGGTGAAQSIARWDLASTLPVMFWYPFTNTSGSDCWVDTATIHNVTNTTGGSFTVGVYDSVDEFGGMGTRLLGESSAVGSMVPGDNFLTFPAQIYVPAGHRVWVVLRAAGGGHPDVLASGVSRLDEGISTQTDPNSALPSVFPAAGWTRQAVILPIDLSQSGGSGTPPVSDMRDALSVSEPLDGGTPSVRDALSVSEPLAEGTPAVRDALSVSEPLAEGTPSVRVPLAALETLHPVEPEGSMITRTLPALPGLSWSVTKEPDFSSRVDTAQSGDEIITAQQDFPIWHFEFTYDYLPDIGAGQTDLKNLMGFFILNQGQFGKWLFQDPDDHSVSAGEIATGDGVTVQFSLARLLGLLEPVGQVAWADALTFAATAVNTTTNQISAPAHGLANGAGPYQVRTTGTLPTPLTVDTNYWVHVVDANTIQIATSQANALAGTVVTLSSGGTGSHTLFSPSVQVFVNGVLQTTGYIVKMPNLLIFDTAPAAGDVVTATFDFYFLCRFSEDKQQFSKFSVQLWELQKMTFQSRFT